MINRFAIYHDWCRLWVSCDAGVCRCILTIHIGRALNRMPASISSHFLALRARLRRLQWGSILLILRRCVQVYCTCWPSFYCSDLWLSAVRCHGSLAILRILSVSQLLLAHAFCKLVTFISNRDEPRYIKLTCGHPPGSREISHWSGKLLCSAVSNESKNTSLLVESNF